MLFIVVLVLSVSDVCLGEDSSGAGDTDLAVLIATLTVAVLSIVGAFYKCRQSRCTTFFSLRRGV